MHPYPYGPYPHGYPAPMPIRMMVPGGYRQNSPPFANLSFDRYAMMPGGPRPPPYMAVPLRYPAGAQPGYPPNGESMPGRAPTRVTSGTDPMPSNQARTPNPKDTADGRNPSNTIAPSVSRAPAPPPRGAKEFKDNAFTINPDGERGEPLRGLVSNGDINDLLKQKGTKVKVKKIYRITKTKATPQDDDDDDDADKELITRGGRGANRSPVGQRESMPQDHQQRPSSQQRSRSSSGSSSCSHCSLCSNCSCTYCRQNGQSHVYDGCPLCRLEWEREQGRQQWQR